MRVKVFALVLAACLALTGCVKVEISLPGVPNKADKDTNATEDATQVNHYPDTIASDYDKLMTPLLPDNIFETTAEENNLTGTLYKIYGTVKEITAMESGAADTIRLQTHKGDVVISNIVFAMESDSSFSELGSVNWEKVKALCPMPEIGEFCCIYAEYQGFSGIYEAPYFFYGSTDYLSEVLLSAVELE